MQHVSTYQNRETFSMPSVLLKLEGLTLLAGAVVVYAHLGFNGWLFLALLLVPDVSMIGYVRSVKLGALTYNIVHTTVTPTILFILSWWGGWTLGIMLALILFAHIGMDRTVGYGLKYSTDFKDTHFNRV